MESARVDGETVAGEDPQSSSSLTAKQKSSRPRRTFEQMAEMCAAELEKLKAMDVSSWTEKKRETHASSIDILAVTVAADVSKLEQNALKRSKTGAGAAEGAATPVRASPMKDGETRRLIYARRVMDVEFDKCINNQASNWDMVADVWNNEFVVKAAKILRNGQPRPPRSYATGIWT
jgi:hypothetical protein